jgi:hypothetical protein
VLNTAFLQAGLIDRIYWLKSTEILVDGVPSVMRKIPHAGINADATMDFGHSATYVKSSEVSLGDDNLSCWQANTSIIRPCAPETEER